VDTPGIHKPVTALGERVNATALDSVKDVDVVCLLIDACKPFGRGDQWVADRIDMANAFVIVNKTDKATPDQVLSQLQACSVLNAAEYFPVSAFNGQGVPELLVALGLKMPEGPQYYPPEMLSDNEEAQWVAELVREQLLAVLKDELPYSVATRVTEWEWPRVRCEILVERESQKGMVIGKGGELLKKVGQKVRSQMKEGAFIELHVVVDKDWQQKPDRLERLGY
jgi:GTP-binding protein Era